MRSILQFAGGSAAIMALSFFGVAPAQDAHDPDLPDGIEIRTSGPVHEAFAQPADVQPEPGELVPKAPPPPVPEEPPEERPEGDNVQFIPGYWAWEPDQNQFLWVSGGYRNVPPGRQWVPGHWVESDGGWRWIPGFWAPEEQQELAYTPEPPAPLQVEPTLAPPDDNSTWVAGTWVYRYPRFVWRPGYWSPFRVGRVWIAPRYLWTPSGYLFCDGYWDYPWDNCGLLFAPVYFSRPYWNTPGWYWRPSYVVNFGLLYNSCFTRRGSFSFYFGNYYGGRYAGLGYNPWFNGYGRYNPYFGYYRWRNGYGGNWYGQQRQLYANRAAGRGFVPPRNLTQQRQLLASKAGLNNNLARAVAPLSQTRTVNKNINLVRLSPAQTVNQKAMMQRTQQVANIRSQAVAAKVGGAGAKATKSNSPIKLPPLARGADTVPSGAPGNAGIRDAKKGGSSPPSVGAKGGNPSVGAGKKNNLPSGVGSKNSPKASFPNSGNNPINPNTGKNRPPSFNPAPITPKSGGGQGPAPKLNNSSPAPKSQGGKGSSPKLSNFKNSAPSRLNDTSLRPRISDPGAAKPRALDAPRLAPAPRSLDRPRTSQPAPKFTAPKSSTPRSNASSMPRFTPRAAPQYSAPRYSAPRSSPAPSYSAPRSSPAPRYSAPRSSPAPRYSAPRSSPAPRSGGGRGRKRG